jgi:hypothetical protein
MATAGNAQVSLTWAASANATSYNLKRSATTGGPYTLLSSPSAASFTDTTVTNGTHTLTAQTGLPKRMPRATSPTTMRRLSYHASRPAACQS